MRVLVGGEGGGVGEGQFIKIVEQEVVGQSFDPSFFKILKFCEGIILVVTSFFFSED